MRTTPRHRPKVTVRRAAPPRSSQPIRHVHPIRQDQRSLLSKRRQRRPTILQPHRYRDKHPRKGHRPRLIRPWRRRRKLPNILFQVIRPIIRPRERAIPSQQQGRHCVLERRAVVLPPSTTLPHLCNGEKESEGECNRSPRYQARQDNHTIIRTATQPPTKAPINVNHSKSNSPRPRRRKSREIRFLCPRPLCTKLQVRASLTNLCPQSQVRGRHSLDQTLYKQCPLFQGVNFQFQFRQNKRSQNTTQSTESTLQSWRSKQRRRHLCRVTLRVQKSGYLTFRQRLQLPQLYPLSLWGSQEGIQVYRLQ